MCYVWLGYLFMYCRVRFDSSGFSYEYLEHWFGCDCNNCIRSPQSNDTDKAHSMVQRWEPILLAPDSGNTDGRVGAAVITLSNGLVLQIGGCSLAGVCDENSDGLIDVFKLSPQYGDTFLCEYAPPRMGADVNSSTSLLEFPRYTGERFEAYTLLQDEAQKYRVGLAWSLIDGDTRIRVAVRAELPSRGYISLGFVHPDWPIRDRIESDPE